MRSEANQREHWRVKAARAKVQRFYARAHAKPRSYVALPVVVTMTRIAPRLLDDDNLAGAFKAIRDGIADALGVDDRDPRVTWRTAQQRGGVREYGCVVTIVERGEG